jgi:hypothetical protein
MAKTSGSKWLILSFQEKLRTAMIDCVTVPQTDSGGLVENTKALERTLVKELGKLTP